MIAQGSQPDCTALWARRRVPRDSAAAVEIQYSLQRLSVMPHQATVDGLRAGQADRSGPPGWRYNTGRGCEEEAFGDSRTHEADPTANHVELNGHSDIQCQSPDQPWFLKASCMGCDVLLQGQWHSEIADHPPFFMAKATRWRRIPTPLN